MEPRAVLTAAHDPLLSLKTGEIIYHFLGVISQEYVEISPL